MSEIVMSWPWYDRAIFGGCLGLFLYGTFLVAVMSHKLGQIIRLLETTNRK